MSTSLSGNVPESGPRPASPHGTGWTRWSIAAAGAALQLCLGTVYAWSYFQQPLVETYRWTHSQVSWAFSLAIASLGLAAAWGGAQLPRFGPRRLAMIGALLFGLGYLGAAVALHLHWLTLLYLSYGVLGGTGLGLGYVTPVATVARWFPERKGLVTGLVIMGFGFGALVMSKLLAPWLLERCDGNLVFVFAWLGVGLGGASMLAAGALQNPLAPLAGATVREASSGNPPESVRAAILSRTFLVIWAIFFCNILAGISIISFQSPLLQDLWRSADAALTSKSLERYGATLIAVSSLFNGVGRMLWGGLSDRIGRLTAFRAMLASQMAAFALLAWTGNPWVFGAAVCYVLLCYGGGFGTMPSLVLDRFGPGRMAPVYGAILTAWSLAGVVGPQLVALLKDRYGAQAAPYAFLAALGFVALGLLLSLILSNRRP